MKHRAQKNKTRPKIIVILGQTATGKSDLAVEIAKKFNGEIISADSRQVYKSLDIGSGKITKKEMRGIKHYLLDVVSLRSNFSVTDFQKKSYEAIEQILEKGKIPIIAGGTAFYIDAIVEGLVFPKITVDKKLRKEISKMPLEKLQNKLKRLDKKRFQEIDQKNKVRLVRAIEIATLNKKVPKLKKNPKFKTLQIGLKWPQDVLEQKIKKRLEKRIKQGMIEEVENLHYKQKISWRRLEELGLEYRYISLYLQNKISKNEMMEKLEIKIRQFSKRQMTWWKRNKKIAWFRPDHEKEIETKVRNFICGSTRT